MFTVYVLKSKKNGKKYVGFTRQEITKRLDWHRWGLTAWTKQNGPFELIYSERFEDKQKAMRREKYFKTGQGRGTLNMLLATRKSSSVSAINHGGPAKGYGGG